jgi:tetratricopeptide (TPR) repeat protein
MIRMRGGFSAHGILILAMLVLSQQIKEEAVVINIEVPVRVFKGNKFVDNLTIADFEIYEDGKPQKIEAVYLVRERQVQKQQGEEAFTPETNKRHFILVFEMMAYSPKVGEAVDYFLRNVIAPGDSLYISTPIRGYNFGPGFAADSQKQEISQRLSNIIRSDIIKGGSEYRGLIKSLQEIRRTDVSPEMKDAMDSAHAELLEKLMGLSCIEEGNLIGFAEKIKKEEGQKHVFIFFQRRMAPTGGSFMPTGNNPAYVDRLFDFYNPRAYFDKEKIKKAFVDSSISCHFLYVTEAPTDASSWMEMNPAEETTDKVEWQDATMDFFNAFREIASATGGVTESSTNAQSLLKTAAGISENYYLLYYAHKDYQADGKFREIKVVVKGNIDRVLHRVGYSAEKLSPGQPAEITPIQKNVPGLDSGLEKYRSGDLEGAIEVFTQIIASAPHHALAYYNRGIIYEELGDTSSALGDYTKAIEINPNYAEAYNNRGCLLVGDGDYEEAIKDFTHAIKVKPDYATAYFNRGSARRGLGEYGDAIPDFRKAMELDSSKKERALEEIKFCESKIRH